MQDHRLIGPLGAREARADNRVVVEARRHLTADADDIYVDDLVPERGGADVLPVHQVDQLSEKARFDDDADVLPEHAASDTKVLRKKEHPGTTEPARKDDFDG
jgi:hypothetical protein